MKVLACALAIGLSGSAAFAAPAKLVCAAKNGNVLEWTEAFGELSVTSPAGKEIVSQDALALGEARMIETSPPIFETQIVYGDETPAEVFAVLRQFQGVTSIELDGVNYVCR